MQHFALKGMRKTNGFWFASLDLETNDPTQSRHTLRCQVPGWREAVEKFDPDGNCDLIIAKADRTTGEHVQFRVYRNHKGWEYQTYDQCIELVERWRAEYDALRALKDKPGRRWA